jgi:hypothetical protein
MKNNRITLVLCILLAWSVIAVVLATPATATENKLLLDPDNSVSDGTPVQVVIYTDISETDKAIAASFDIEYDPNCVKDFPVFDATGSGWVGGVSCSNPAPGVLRFSSSVAMNPAISGHVMFGTLTFTCNTAGCESSLNFANTPKYTDASQPPQAVYPALDNGVFRCASTLGVEDGGEENEGGDGNPTHSPDPTNQDITSPSIPSPTATQTPAATPATNSNPPPSSSKDIVPDEPITASSPKEMRTPASPGFELMIAVGMLIAAMCLIRKRGRR